jgi:hypothetical protein
LRDYDLILKGARIVDPVNGLDDVRDLAIKGPEVADVEHSIDVQNGRNVIDLSGKTIMPGVIDPHTHFLPLLSRKEPSEVKQLCARACNMMVKSGVITAVDQGGLMENVFGYLNECGAGMNVAVNSIVQGYLPSVNDQTPSRSQLRESADRAIENGAIGIKILGSSGNPFPLTPEATRSAIEIANEKRIYVAFHVGTSATSSSIDGLREAIELAGGNRVHLAHIACYCREERRGKDPVAEAMEALEILRGKGNLVSESYISPYDPSSGECVNGIPQDRSTRTRLTLRGYAATEDGLKQAILKEAALVEEMDDRLDVVMLRKGEALDCWRKAKTRVRVHFSVNVAEATILLTVRKDDQGEFIVDAIRTDGGASPRNVMVTSGLALVRYGALTLDDFVMKTSYNASRMLGMTSKGHLGMGADADITVLDLSKGMAVMSLALGKVIMKDGVAVGRGGTVITTKRGEKRVRESGLPYQVIDLEDSTLYE